MWCSSSAQGRTNERLTRDLRRILMDMNNGERAVQMYVFRRGGSQALLDWSGKY